jgi:UDP-2-acetamido-2-deoxy-ribo-hexuluronate aminotransferase
MQFIDLAAQQKRIRADLDRRIAAVLDHGKYIMGPEVTELEERLADYVGVKHCISCASGTDALLMALIAKGVGPGDAVFTTPFTFIATAEVISLVGATPVFVDIDPATYNIDPDKLRQSIESLEAGRSPTEAMPEKLVPKGIVAVDLFGLPADYDTIAPLAREHGLFILEDAAQSFGATYKGRAACSLAELAATSFFPAKPLGCYGDGGAVFTRDDDLATLMRSIRIHGKGSNKYDNVRIGINGRLDTIQAAVLLAKMEILDGELDARREAARRYDEGLRDAVAVPVVPQDYRSAWAQYTVQSDRRDELMTSLKQAGIPTAIYYPKPLHLQEAFAGLGYAEGDMPVSEHAAGRVFSLPMSGYVKDDEQGHILSAIQS